MSKKITESPVEWKVDQYETIDYYFVMDGDDTIAKVYKSVERGDSLENANVFAASRELLAACEKALRRIDRLEGDSTMALYDQMEAAIAKARGEAE